MQKKIEILSPGGDPDAVKAAILAGANAVYLGLKKFNARKRAENIDNETLKDLINIAHSRNVRIFVTMNILLTEKEIEEAINTVAELITIGVDAVIVQDAGFAYMIQKLFPSFEIHASTQMTTHNSLQIDFIKQFGIKQLNFSRELSAKELKPLIIRAHENELKTEIFVHGAYCISCSGICYMSAFISAQPGNRGACLQPCRRLYKTPHKDEEGYFLSLKDNNALRHAEELIGLGADSLKIEGRIKNFNYVYQVTNAWKKTLDNLYHPTKVQESYEDAVKKVFNRDFSTGYFSDKISSEMFVNSPLDNSLKKVGVVDYFHADKKNLVLKEPADINPGSRINIYTEENSFICGAIVKKKNNPVSYLIEIENQLKGKILNGQLVLLLNELDEANFIKKQIENLLPVKTRLDIKISGRENEPLVIVFAAGEKMSEFFSVINLSKAQKNSLDEETIINQMGRLGDTNFELGNIDLSQMEQGLFIPLKELNRMRREAVDFLNPVKPEYQFPQYFSTKRKKDKKIALLVATKKDADFFVQDFDGLIFLETGTNNKTTDFDSKIMPWLPPFILDDEITKYQALINTVNPEILVSDNSGMGKWAGEKGIRWITGPQLNATNGFSFYAYQEYGLASGGFYSNELNKEQIGNITVPENFLSFYTVFGPILLMTTRQCLFLKPGLCKQNKKYKDDACLNGCINYTEYSDEKNVPFHIVKSAGHLNRIFNDSFLFIPEAMEQINADYYLLDFRSFPFVKINNNEKKQILDYFNNLIFDAETARRKEKNIKQIIGNVTYGNYKRGFE